jgi:hypothetical protein
MCLIAKTCSYLFMNVHLTDFYVIAFEKLITVFDMDNEFLQQKYSSVIVSVNTVCFNYCSLL